MTKQLGPAYCLPNHEAVLETIHAVILRESLVKAADGRKKDERMDIVEVWVPGMPLCTVSVR